MKGRKFQKGARSKYGQAFRDQVARDYESGDLSYSQIAEKYELPNRELAKWWVRSYRKNSVIETIPLSPMTEKEKQEVKALQNRIKELEKQVSDRDLHVLALDTMIDVAEEMGMDIRKKPGTKQSKD
jgi:transposase-like protein